MKQTNNAIKFLMAQYRAIFQNAYFKGLATAAVVTMGLAAGQAQAAEETTFTQSKDAETSITIDGVHHDTTDTKVYTKFAVTASPDDPEKFANTSFTIAKGAIATPDNKIAGAAAGGTTFKAKKITIDVGTNDAATNGLKVVATDGNATVQLTDLAVTKGTLDISAASGKNAKVEADTISVGEAGTISIGSTDTWAILGTATTTYDLESGSTLSVGKSGSVLGNISDAAGVNIKFTEAGTLKADGTNVNANISVTAEKTGTIDLVGTESKTLALSAGKITVSGGNSAGTLKVASGTILDLDPSVVIEGASADKGTLSIVNGATLKAGATQIKKFLNADANKGILSLAGTWELKGTGDDLDIGGLEGASDTAGKVAGLAKSTKITGQDITVSTALTTFTDANIVAADTLTLGKDTEKSAVMLGGAKATAKDLVLLTNEDTGFNLQDDITLTAVSGTTEKTADSVTLEEKIVLAGNGKTLTVEGGKYTAEDLTVGSGSVMVSNHTDNVDSTLTIKTLVLDNNKNGATGKLTAKSTAAGKLDNKVILDLTNTEISYAVNENTKNSITLEANKATIKIAGEKLTELLNVESSFSGAIFDVKNDGQLSVTEGLELKADQLKPTSARNNGLKLTKGTLNVDGTLTLKEAATVDLENADGTAILKAKTLDLQVADPSTQSSTLQSGNFVVSEGLKTNSQDAIVVGANGKLQLNDEAGASHTVYANALSVSGGSATLDVEKGTWTLNDLSLGTTGVANVKSGTVLNVSGKLTATETGSKFKVADGATATVEQIASSAQDQINVSGTMTVAGKITKDGNNRPNGYGVQLADDSIQMAATGKLSFGEDATKAITVGPNGVTVFTGSFADGGAIKSIAGSEVAFSFDEKTKFTEAALKDLRTKIFGSVGGALVEGRINLGKATIAGIDENIENNKISWADIKGLSDSIGDTTSEKLSQAIVTDVTSADKIRGHYGAIQSKDASAITIGGNTSLNNAAANNGMFAQGADNQPSDFNVNVGTLELNNGGKAGTVKLEPNTTLQVNGSQTTIEAIDGKKASVVLAQGATTVTNNANIKNFTDVANSSLTVGKKLTLGDGLAAGQKTTILGSVKAGSADFKADAVVSGDVEVTSGDLVADKTFTATGNLKVKGNTTFSGTATLSGQQNEFAKVSFNATGNNFIKDGQTFASEVSLGTNADLIVGTEPTTALSDGASAYLVTDKLSLNGNALVVDPHYTVESSIVVADQLSTIPSMDTKTDAGQLSGAGVVLQNSILAIGLDTTDRAAAVAKVKSELAPLFEANGALDKDNVGAVTYTAKAITLGAGDKLVVDSERSLSKFKTDAGTVGTAFATAVNDSEIYLGTNSALAVDGAAFGNNGKAAITLEAGSSIYAGKNSKVILTGKDAMNADGNMLFGVNGSGTLNLTGAEGHNSTLRVETINGWFYQDLKSANLTNALDLNIDKTKADKDLEVVSEPVRDTLLSAAYCIHNYDEYLDKKANNSWDEATMAQDVLGEVAPSSFKYNVEQDKFFEGNVELTDTEAKKKGIDVESSKKYGVVYLEATNALLENILYSNGNAVDAETNARLAVFGGAPQAAIEAGASTYEAISARMGVGVSGVSAAANGQGGAIWVTPVYKSADADGFNADNKSYGADVKLYGLALGADIEVAPNFKVGGMFNVGSGDADGQGLGSNVSNDFDYYGLGLYAGYSMDAFSLVADVTYTAVDNDIEGNTDLGKVNASIDSTNLSVGVTGQYKLSVAGMDVTPHAGLRYSMIDMDDYSTAYSQNDSDSINIFSLPVGVTIAKEYVTDTWTVKPSFDLTLTGNFGDDEVDATAKWNGYSNLSTTVKSEIMDNFTYGAAVGVSATSGNFGLGLGVNYTGSSNTDEFGVNANARYMF